MTEDSPIVGIDEEAPGKMTTIAILQPGYIPWLGFFDLMVQSDVFVYYDDVQYDKHGWRNRNRIRDERGNYQWLSVPVLAKGDKRNINEVRIDHGGGIWRRKHLRRMRQAYAKAPYFEKYWDEMERVIGASCQTLVELNYSFVEQACHWLGIERQIERSSHLNIEGARTERLVSICRHFRADEYLSGDAAKAYLDESAFSEAGIHLRWHQYDHPIYPQLHEDFMPYLSVVDLLFNCGPMSREILSSA